MSDLRAQWLSHLPLVRFTLNRMKATGELHQTLDDDLLQEGYLAVGQALETHDAAKGKVSTWVCAHVRYAALDYLNKVNAGGVKSAARVQVQMVDLPPDEDESDDSENEDDTPRTDGADRAIGLSYHLPPEGYANPEDIVARARALRTLRFALDLLADKDRDLLVVLFGLGGEPMSLADYGAARGMSRQAVYDLRQAALRRLAYLMGVAGA